MQTGKTSLLELIEAQVQEHMRAGSSDFSSVTRVDMARAKHGDSFKDAVAAQIPDPDQWLETIWHCCKGTCCQCLAGCTRFAVIHCVLVQCESE